jgi:hypothetical protein
VTEGRSREAIVDLPLLHALLDVDETQPARELVRVARSTSGVLQQLVLSVMERDGHPLGSGSRDELARARTRSAVYEHVYDLVRAVTPACILKGPSLARLYPDGLVRAVGDLDLVVTDEAALWAGMRAVMDYRPDAYPDVSVLDTDQRSVFARVSWPAPDPAFDNDISIEFATVGYIGDLKTVYPRQELPATPEVADLLALAEERFQRPFEPKDAIDVLILGQHSFATADEVLSDVIRFKLAPEVAELLEYAASFRSLGPLLEAVQVGARAVADDELAARSERAGDQPLQPRYGMLLKRTSWRSEFAPATVHSSGAVELLRTPVGTYLLVTSAEVDPDVYEKAMATLAGLRS